MSLFNLLFAEKGIVVAISDRYMEYAMPTLMHIRENLSCNLSIEVWHSGDELSINNQNLLKQHISNLCIRDLAPLITQDTEYFRGFQIKGKILQYTQFDEILLVDADVYFYVNPELLFAEEGYKRTGAFFFQDIPWTIFPKRKSHAMKHYSEEYRDKRYAFIHKHIKSPSKYMPKEWQFYWDKKKFPKKGKGVRFEHQESGCVLLDAKRHKQAIKHIIALNEDWKNTYQCVWGDKETFWIACEMAKEPYYVNPVRPFGLFAQCLKAPHKGSVFQFVGGDLIYQQKHPDYILSDYMFKQFKSKPQAQKDLLKKELTKIRELFCYKEQIHKKIFQE